MGLQRIVLIAFLSLAVFPAAAQDRAWTITGLDDDDFWAPHNHDQYYTHGIRFSATSGDVTEPRWEAPFTFIDGIVPIFPTAPGIARRYNLIALGQNMYTPRNRALFNPDPRDRPYAGWLYGGAGMMQDTPGESGAADRFDELALKLGIVGPGALANAVQTHYHLMIDVAPFAGWHAQLRNEPAVDFFYQHKWRFHDETAAGWGWDAIPQWDLRLGTVYDYAGLGGLLRIGRNLRVDYGPPHIDLNTGADYINPTRAASGNWSFYGLLGTELRAVGHNIFLDGNDFTASAHVNKIPAVADLEAGLAIAYRHWRLTYTYIVRSPEYTHQVGLDHYGALSLTLSRHF